VTLGLDLSFCVCVCVCASEMQVNGNGMSSADLDLDKMEDKEYEYKRLGWYIDTFESMYEAVVAQVTQVVGDDMAKSMPIAMTTSLLSTISSALPIETVISVVHSLLKQIDTIADTAIVSASNTAEYTYTTLAPTAVQGAVKEFMWAKGEFQKEFLRQTQKQQEDKDLQKSSSDTVANGNENGSEKSGNGIIPSMIPPPSVERIMTAGKRAFTAVAMKKFEYDKENKPPTDHTAALDDDLAKEEVAEKDDITIEKICVHGVWALDIDRSEPWDALLEVLGIEHRKISDKSQMRPSTQEFYHVDDEISHRIYSSSGRRRDGIEPTVFIIGAAPIKESSADGDVIQTRYYYSDGGIVQESINPEKDVTVITTRTLEDENTMVQMSVARRDGKTASVKRIFNKIEQTSNSQEDE